MFLHFRHKTTQFERFRKRHNLKDFESPLHGHFLPGVKVYLFLRTFPARPIPDKSERPKGASGKFSELFDLIFTQESIQKDTNGKY